MAAAAVAWHKEASRSRRRLCRSKIKCIELESWLSFGLLFGPELVGCLHFHHIPRPPQCTFMRGLLGSIRWYLGCHKG